MYEETLTKAMRGLSREMLETQDHDHKDTCIDCPNVRTGDESNV